MVAGTFDIFKGPLKDNKGKEVIPAGKSLKQTDISLEGMNYLVEGVVGSASDAHPQAAPGALRHPPCRGRHPRPAKPAPRCPAHRHACP